MREIALAPEALQILGDVLKRTVPEADVWIYGSRVRGEARRFSDIDLAMDAGAPLSLGTLAELRDALEASDLPYRVDLTDLANVAPEVRARLLTRAQRIQCPTATA